MPNLAYRRVSKASQGNQLMSEPKRAWLPPTIREEDKDSGEEEPTTASSGRASCGGPSSNEDAGDADFLVDESNLFQSREMETIGQDSHLSLPPGLFEEDVRLPEDPWNRNVVIIGNVPDAYTPALLLKEMTGSGFRHELDFDMFFMPVDSITGMHFGYGLASFFDPAVQKQFMSAFHGRPALGGEKFAVQLATAEDLVYVHLQVNNEVTSSQQLHGRSHAKVSNFCPYCGARAARGFNFCPECGGGLGTEGRQPPSWQQHSEKHSLHPSQSAWQPSLPAWLVS